MLLSVHERLLLMSALPQEGNVLTLRVVRDLQKELSLTEEEIKTGNVTEDKGRIAWEKDKLQDKEIAVGEAARKVIVDALERQDREGRLRMDMLDLYERFMSSNGEP